MIFNDELRMAVLSINPYAMQEIQERAKREEDIVKVMTVFDALAYNAQPTFEQVEQLVERVEATGREVCDLYLIFCSGITPHWLDTLIKELAVNWRPNGKIVGSEQ